MIDGLYPVRHPDIQPFSETNFLVRITFSRSGKTRTFTSAPHSSQMYGLGFSDSEKHISYPLTGANCFGKYKVELYRIEETFDNETQPTVQIEDNIIVNSCVEATGFKGMVKEVFANKTALIMYHNGVKITETILDLNKLTKISRRQFIEYCRERGDTAMYQYL